MFYQSTIKLQQVNQRVFEDLKQTPQVEDQGSYSTLIPNEKMIEF